MTPDAGAVAERTSRDHEGGSSAQREGSAAGAAPAPLTSGAGLLAPGAPQLDPGQLRAIQSLAGNAAVSGLVQRAPDTATKTSPTAAVKKRPRPQRSTPLQPIGMLPDIINMVPDLITRVDGGISGYTENMRAKYGDRFSWSAGKDAEDAVPTASIGAATLYARDAVYRMAGDGAVQEVESNLDGPIDPINPDVLPPTKYPMQDPSVYVLDPASRNLWQVVIRFTSAVDEDTGNATGKLHLMRSQDPVQVPKDVPKGQLILLIYAPKNVAAREGATLPGFKAMALEPQPDDAPPWAKKKLVKLQKLLAATASDSGKDVRGTGLGQKGEGPGGGGAVANAAPGGPAGLGRDAGKGAGRLDARRRAKPDKVVLWQGKKGPMLNVWKGRSHEAIPIRESESEEDLQDRVERSAGKQTSTGQEVADGAEHTGKRGGEGDQSATAEEIEEATKFTANALAYPSKLAMLGGSGAEISPAGWATTIKGAFHNFDMVLDYDARNFGLANQTFARLGWVHYYWQVIDITGMSVGKTEEGGEQSRTQVEGEKEEQFRQRLRKVALEGAKDDDRTRVANKLDTYWARARNEKDRQAEGIDKDVPSMTSADTIVTWPVKAPIAAAAYLSAGFSVLKNMLAGWFAKATEPENRQEIEFDKPGDYIVRCLANPYVNEEKPYEEQTRRATSIAVFPVRVVAVDQRARDVTRNDRVQLERANAAIAYLEKAAQDDPSDEAKKMEVEQAYLARDELKKWYDYTTVQKADRELEDYDKQIRILEELKDDVPVEYFRGDDLITALDIRRDVRRRLGRDENVGFVGWFDYENHLTDVKEARKKKAELRDLAKEKSSLVKDGEQLRPRVTFVSEENGALVRMEMILGPSRSRGIAKTEWVLADVTAEPTQGTYMGRSQKEGDEGKAEAVLNAFETFAEKAEYGRGTIAIEIPGHPELIEPGKTMLMQPGALGRWKERLHNLVEIATLVTAVAPAMRGAKLIGRFAEIGGLVEAGGTIIDKAAHDQLRLNFETVSNVVNLLVPVGKGAASLAARPAARGKMALTFVSKTTSMANDLMLPIGIFRELDVLVRDTSMDPAQKRAAIARLLARGMKDGTITLQGKAVGAKQESDQSYAHPMAPPDSSLLGAHLGGGAGGAPRVPTEAGGQTGSGVGAVGGSGGTGSVGRANVGGPVSRVGGDGAAPLRPDTDVQGRFDTSDTPVEGPGPSVPKPSAPDAPAPLKPGTETAMTLGGRDGSDVTAPKRTTDEGDGADTIPHRDDGSDAGTGTAKTGAKEMWMGREAHSDLPGGQVGASIGRGVPKMKRADVEAPDSAIKGGVGVGQMFTKIKKGVFKAVGKPGSGSSESVVMVNTTNGKKYLFKPLGGEPDVWYAADRGVVAGHYAERAKAGQESAAALGVDTPNVMLVEINGRKGSLTEWVKPTEKGGQVIGLDKFAEAEPQAFDAIQKTPEFVEALSGVQALDYLINNLDRVNNLGNYMIEFGANGSFKRLVPIDQELAFTTTAQRAIIPDKTSYMPQRWTKSLADHVDALHKNPGPLVAKLKPLVGEKAVAGMLERLNQLHADAVRRGALPPPAGAPGTKPGTGGGGGGTGGGAPLGAGGRTVDTGAQPLGTGGGTVGTGQPRPLGGGGGTVGTGQPAPLGGGGTTGGSETIPTVRRDGGGPSGPGGPGSGGGAGGSGGGGGGGGRRPTVVGGTDDRPFPADLDVAGAAIRGLSETDADQVANTDRSAPNQRPVLSEVESAQAGPANRDQNRRINAAVGGRVPIGLPHPAVVQAARERMHAGTGTLQDAMTIVRQAVGVTRAWAAADIGGVRDMTGSELAGRCAMARDLTALSLASQLEGSGVQAVIRRYSLDGLAERVTGEKHQFTTVEFHFPDGRVERFIVDPTFAQFVDIGGTVTSGKSGDRARGQIGSAESLARLLEDGFLPLNRTTASFYLDSLVPPGRPAIDPRLLLYGAGGGTGDPTGKASHLDVGRGEEPVAEQLLRLDDVQPTIEDLKRAADDLRTKLQRPDLAHEVDELRDQLDKRGLSKVTDKEEKTPDLSNVHIDEDPRPGT